MKPQTVRIWLFDCGRVHVETRHCRQSFTPTAFITLLRDAAGMGGVEASLPVPSRLNEACETNPAVHAARQPFDVFNDKAA
jgi:hypothetical protein